MYYLYAGLSVAMISGIMHVVEMASSITSQQIYSRPPDNSYLGSSAQQSDQQWISLLKDSSSDWGVSNTLCSKLISEGSARKGELSLLSNYIQDISSPSSNERLIGSCALVDPVTAHRVLISPTPTKPIPFSLFSCILISEAFCPIELND